MEPDYETYSYEELVDAKENISKQEFPERYERLKQQICLRKSGIKEVAKQNNEGIGETRRLKFKFKIHSKNLLYLLVCLGAIYTIFSSIDDGTLILKGSEVSIDRRPGAFWFGIIFMGVGCLLSAYCFFRSFFYRD